MTFQDFFTKCQMLITEQIDLPFDSPFPQKWLDKFTPEFEMYYNEGLTPDEAVEVHFSDRILKVKACRRNDEKL